MQAKDIDTVAVLRRIRAVQTSIGSNVLSINGWNRENDMEHQEWLWPEKVLRAKLSRMTRNGLIDGCNCGCRGDFTITAKGAQLLESLPREEGQTTP